MVSLARWRSPSPVSTNGHTSHLPETRSYTLADATFSAFLGLSGQTDAGVNVTESSAMGLSAVFRAVALISGTIAGLPLKSYRNQPNGTRERIPTWLDNPNGPDGMTGFEWVELVLVHLLLHGNVYLLHIYNGAGAIVGLQPIHPSMVDVRPVKTTEERRKFSPYTKYFHVSDGALGRDFSPVDLTHIPGLGTDGLKGLSVISTLRQGIGTGIAGDQAAARTFKNGLLLGGIATVEGELTKDEAAEVSQSFKARAQGTKNAGDIAFINKAIKFQPWTMSLEDAQFIQSRAFQVEDIARMFGLMPIHLAQTEKQTSWGTGIAEQNLGLARYCLMGWTSRIEQRLSRLLPRPQFCEFDFKGLLQGTPKDELELLALQIDKNILDVDEARAILNLPPRQAPTPEVQE